MDKENELENRINKLDEIKTDNTINNTSRPETNIENMIYEIRGVQVMLDSDLARLYLCETGHLNRARKRNIERFPDNFSFQITKKEYIDLKCQYGISNIDLRAINRSMPYVYTEQGIAMLASVLHTKVAIETSIKIMDIFVTMRNYISSNMLEQQYINNLVIRNDSRLTLVENTLNKLSEKQHLSSIFFEGQIFDAYIFLLDLLSKAKEEIIIIY